MSGVTADLLDSGWDYHDRESERLARELEAGADAGVSDDDLAGFLHLSTHTIGEHLGDWPRALRLGRRVLAGRTPTRETARAWARLQVAATLAGEAIEAAELELSCLNTAGDAFAAALLDMRFMLVAALVGGKRSGEAAQIYGSALDLARSVGASAQLDRTIAAASNNLGWELCELPSRSAADDALMTRCAQTGLEFWLRCGDWINEERALYLKAAVANATADPRAALADAEMALAVIAAHSERPLDAALLHLTRARSFAALGDAAAARQAIAEADAAAAKLSAPALKAQFDSERAKAAAAIA